MNPLVNRSRLFDDFFKDLSLGYYVRPLHGDPLPSPDQIKIDVKESGNNFIVKADLPGVNKDDIHVSIDGNVVTVRAEIKQQDIETDNENDRVLRSERFYGAVSRSFALPVAVDQANGKAKYENGVLMLTLPKEAANVSKRLTVE